MNILEQRLEKHIELLVSRYPQLENCKQDIVDAYLIMENCYLRVMVVLPLIRNI